MYAHISTQLIIQMYQEYAHSLVKKIQKNQDEALSKKIFKLKN